jgi:hypothetical protein
MMDNETLKAFLPQEFKQATPQDNGSDIASILQRCEIDYNNEYEDAPTVISIDGQRIATLGNFSVLIGKAKSRKTFFATAITAAALRNGTFCGVTATLPDEKNVILYFDTEQSTFDCSLVLKRIVTAAGRRPDDLRFFSLRKFNPKERTEIISHAINTIENIGLVVIDGIRDLVSNINNEYEATAVSGHLMKWSQEQNIHIVTVLHQNKADNNARGHVGTEVINKGETVLSITKDERTPNISLVNPEFSRAIDSGRIAFCIDENGLPALVEDYAFEDGQKVMTDGQHYKDVVCKIFDPDSSLQYSELVNAIREQTNVGMNKAKTYLQHYQNVGMITATGTAGTKLVRYSKNEKYEDLPF